MIDQTSNVRAVSKKSTVDRWLDENETKGQAAAKSESSAAVASKQKLHRKLMSWYMSEREIQAANRYQMAVDHDYYDNIQFSMQDEQEIIDRGQAPVVYNETAASVDWIIGTEKRTRVDFKVLPRAEDDVKTADAKTKVLKWNGDVNNTVFIRSKAFEDCVKGGLGWLEDGACGDPTQEPLFSRYESWRNIIDDSKSVEIGGEDARFLFRIKWLDLDVACALLPNRRSILERASTSETTWGREEDEDLWYLGQHFTSRDAMGHVIDYRTYISDASMVVNRRERVKIIEAWYRVPERCQICEGDVFHGERYDPKNDLMKQAVKHGIVSLNDQVRMSVRVALLTESDLLQDMASPYKHNRFPFTPIRCYRRGRDGAPYGVIRRWRDVQDDLNKRASKALFILSTNRVIADVDAVEDHDEAREEVARPDAYIIKKRGSEFKIENDTQLAEEHLMMMERDARLIRNIGGVTDDNLGRKSNAISGEAIKARQLQGSVTTASLFDNLRLAVKLQGEIQLSLAEQYITMPKVIRLTGDRGKIEWLKINQPEVDGNGETRFVNDIAASKADFVVDEQDFHQSVRQSMFETMVDLVGKIAAVNAEAALRILKMSLEFSDMPNKDEMAGEIAAILGLDTNKDPADMTPEEQAEYKAKAEAKKAQQQMAQQQAQQTLDQQAAEIKQTMAAAQKLLAEAQRAHAAASETTAKAQALQLETSSRDIGAESDTQIRESQARTQKTIADADLARANADAARQAGDAQIRQSAQQNGPGGAQEVTQRMNDTIEALTNHVGKVIAQMAKQQENGMKAVNNALSALEMGQHQLMEAAAADQETDFDFKFDDNGEIVGATKKAKRKSKPAQKERAARVATP